MDGFLCCKFYCGRSPTSDLFSSMVPIQAICSHCIYVLMMEQSSSYNFDRVASAERGVITIEGMFLPTEPYEVTIS